MAGQDQDIKKERTTQGIRVITDYIPHVQSVSISITCDRGSRYEDVNMAGVSHFIEHMLFKGTKKRTAKEIALCLEEVGGYLNAQTGKEDVVYYACVGMDYIDRAFDLLSDIITNATLDDTDMERERGVIMREIATYNDLPQENLIDNAVRLLFGENDGYGIPVVGYSETVGRMGREDLLWHLSQNYKYNDIVVTAVGNLEHRSLMEMVEEKLERGLNWNGGIKSELRFEPPEVKSINERKLEQQYICHIWKGIKYSDERRYALSVLNAILCGMVSSRLFQRLREDMGLVYDISSTPRLMRDAGFFAIMYATYPQAGGKVISIVREEVEKLLNEGISEGELKTAKEYIKGGIMLGLESTITRMMRLIKNEVYLGRIIPLKESIERFDGVTREEVEEVARELFSDEGMVVAVGPKVKKLSKVIRGN